jgi:hypothetical protein
MLQLELAAIRCFATRLGPVGAAALMLLAFLVTIDTPVLGEGENALRYNRLPGRGINLGDALEARREGEGCHIEVAVFSRNHKCGL